MPRRRRKLLTDSCRIRDRQRNNRSPTNRWELGARKEQRGLELMFGHPCPALSLLSTRPNSGTCQISKPLIPIDRARPAHSKRVPPGPWRVHGALPACLHLDCCDQIDIMMLYTPEAAAQRGITETQLLTRIVEAMMTLNQAIANSAIANLEFRLVHVEEVRIGAGGACSCLLCSSGQRTTRASRSPHSAIRGLAYHEKMGG